MKGFTAGSSRSITQKNTRRDCLGSETIAMWCGAFSAPMEDAFVLARLAEHPDMAPNLLSAVLIVLTANQGKHAFRTRDIRNNHSV